LPEEESTTLAPHGGMLVDRTLKGELRKAALERATGCKRVTLSSVGISDLELIAVGAYSPLTGFMTSADYRRVLEEMHLANGIAWSMPVTLPVSREEADALHEGEEVALIDSKGRIMGVLELTEKFTYDKEREAGLVYRTTDAAHPGVARLYAQGDVLLGGDVYLLERPYDRLFPEFHHDPAQSRRMFARRGWRRVVGFQTRNPIHRAHEYIQKTALEIVDGLFLHPLVGETKPDDIPADVRMRSYQSLLRDYYPPDRVILGIFPAAMRYAGPREAIFHALCRKNYGCTHFIVGRDHAGVGRYYGPYEAQRIFDDFAPGELGIIPLFFDATFWCYKCGGIVSAKTCPHDPSHHLILSGTQVREMLLRGEGLPAEFTRPEVAEILREGLLAQVQERETREKRETKDLGAKRGPAPRKVFIIGLDCADPLLVFKRWRDELPNIAGMMRDGLWGSLNSSIPPITVPAWSCMMASLDPGELGIYGFRNRADYSYDRMTIATSNAVTADRVWDILSRAGRRVVVLGVPGTYPPSPVNGVMVGCCLTPSVESPYTYPISVKEEIAALVGKYLVDVPDFRTEDKDYLLRQTYEMTEGHFKLVKQFMREKPWDFFMFVEMGVDRIHHGFWKYHDPTHPRYEPGNPYETVIKDYYRHIDRQIGEILAALDEDTVVMVVSDHGAKKMDGGLCINEWLHRNGYLTIKDQPGGIVPLEKVEIDWSRTVAWGEGGYCGRLFLNVQGREPQGVVSPADYERVRDEIRAGLEAITDPAGRSISTVVYKPQEVYRICKGVPPDLIVYFGDLDWRSVGSLGHGGVHTFVNDIGPDDANHARQGMFLMYDQLRSLGGREVAGLDLMDVAPTVLDLMGLPVPGYMRGKIIGK
jgi:ATP sulfurylase